MRRALLAVVVSLAGAGASAQVVTLAPSQALACMTPPEPERGLPAYPAELVTAKIGGTVRVELVFTAPDRAPAVRVLDDSASTGLEDAVRAHAARLRVPCLPPGAEPARIAQDYVFRPDDGRRVAALAPEDLDEPGRHRLAACLTRIAGPALEYPRRAQDDGQEGNYLVRLRFTNPAAAPEIRIVAGPQHAPLRRALNGFAQEYRLPCMGTAPVELDLLYSFRIDGYPRTVLKDMRLTQMLGSAARMPLPASFDFSTMGCPFDLRVTHRQPYARHVVKQIEPAHPGRRSFIDWLAQVELKLSDQQSQQVLGDTFTVSVPCAKLDL